MARNKMRPPVLGQGPECRCRTLRAGLTLARIKITTGNDSRNQGRARNSATTVLRRPPAGAVRDGKFARRE